MKTNPKVIYISSSFLGLAGIFLNFFYDIHFFRTVFIIGLNAYVIPAMVFILVFFMEKHRVQSPEFPRKTIPYLPIFAAFFFPSLFFTTGEYFTILFEQMDLKFFFGFVFPTIFFWITLFIFFFPKRVTKEKVILVFSVVYFFLFWVYSAVLYLIPLHPFWG